MILVHLTLWPFAIAIIIPILQIRKLRFTEYLPKPNPLVSYKLINTLLNLKTLFPLTSMLYSDVIYRLFCFFPSKTNTKASSKLRFVLCSPWCFFCFSCQNAFGSNELLQLKHYQVFIYKWLA